VLRIAKEASATLGSEFFQSLARHLLTALDSDYVYIGELSRAPAGRLRTLAACKKPGELDGFEQDLAGTASEQVLTDGAYSCSRGVTQIFPLDTRLEQMRAESFVGVRLSDSSGQPLGLLATVFAYPAADVALVKAVLEAFQPRAAAELERKRAEDALKESEERYRAFITSNPDGMWRIEFEQPIPTDLSEEEQIERIFQFGYVAECNEAMSRLAGFESVEELTGARFGDVVPRSDRRLMDELRAAIRSHFRITTVETNPTDADGRRLYRLRSQLGIVENGELHRIWGTTRDLTGLRRTELALAKSERRFHDVLESIQMPAVMLDAEGVITFANDCLAQLTQRSREELIGANWLETVLPADQRAVWNEALRPQVPGEPAPLTHFEGTILAAGQISRLIAWSTTVLRNESGEREGLAAVGPDITGERSLEQELRQAQKLESIGRLAAGVAHDFNNVLTVILGQMEQILVRVEPSFPEYGRLTAIQQAATKCTELTQQLLTIGRRQQVHPKRIGLNSLIDGEEGMIRSLIGETIALIIDRAKTLWEVYADPGQIQRVLMNLVTNARDAMPKGGLLVIQTVNLRVDEKNAEYPSNVTPGDYVRMSVIDTGSGLTEEVKAHLFEPFFTTKQPGKGSGLGLSTIYGIVSQTGGYVFYTSEPGKGAKFEVLLPAAQD
jgi:PAS domain S-box-containing protein